MARAKGDQEGDRGIVRMAIVENFRSNLKDHLQAMKMLGHPVQAEEAPRLVASSPALEDVPFEDRLSGRPPNDE